MCISNLSAQPLSLPAGAELLLASSELIDGRLPVDATAWLRSPDRGPSEPAEGVADEMSGLAAGPQVAGRRGIDGAGTTSQEEYQE